MYAVEHGGVLVRSLVVRLAQLPYNIRVVSGIKQPIIGTHGEVILKATLNSKLVAASIVNMILYVLIYHLTITATFGFCLYLSDA